MKSRIPIAALAIAALTVGVGALEVAVAVGNGNGIDLTSIGVITFLAFPAMGLLIIHRSPANAIGWLLLAIGLNVYIIFLGEDYAAFALLRHPGSLPAGEFFAWLSTWSYIPFLLMVLVFLPMLFPNGRLLSPRWRVIVASGLAYGLMAFANAFLPGGVSTRYPGLTNPLGLEGAAPFLRNLLDLSIPFVLVALLGSVASVVVRYRRGDSLQRRQLRWFLCAVPLGILPFLLNDVNPFLSQVLVGLFVPLLPVSIAIAVLRYRLYDIDLVINRALVYGALAVFITAVYVSIVVGLGALIGSSNRPNALLSILATAVVAVAFQPVREWIQRLANRLVYGRRATPYQVMAGFADRMAETLAVEEVLPKMAEAAARGVDGLAARVTLRLPNGSDRVTTWPPNQSAGEFSHAHPILYRGELVGEIAIGKRPGESLTAPETSLLLDLASQAGLVLHNVRLTSELRARLEEITDQAAQLRASRYRIVAARQTEQQRLEGEIRGSVQGGLESIKAELSRAERLLVQDPAQASAAVDGLTAQTQAALDQLRELARGIFPPLLADRGLVSALQAHLRKGEVHVSIDAAAGLATTRLDPSVEAAVYFACIEALRRATASTIIRLADEGGELRFTVNGIASVMNGEMQDSQDRIAAVGGTLEIREEAVSGRIPLATATPTPIPED
jgi:signal transduction histidine kinase